jgi:hypothetical protein
VSATLTDNMLANERANSMARVYQNTNRILTGERLTCVTTKGGSDMPAAWTDGAEITFNLDAIGDIDFANLVKYHGINFHELCHVLYTPRKGTALAKSVIEERLFRAFNLLEDQRIETLFVAQYRSAVPWLTAAILQWVLREGSASTGYLFVRGRRYLPGTLRGALRKSFVRQDLLAEADEIIDAYRLLVFPTDYDTALDLIRRFNRILIETNASMASDPHHNPGEGEDEMADKGRPSGVAEQRSARDRADEGEPESLPSDESDQSDEDWDDDEFGDDWDDDLDGEDDDLSEDADGQSGSEGDNESDSDSESGSDSDADGGESESEQSGERGDRAGNTPGGQPFDGEPSDQRDDQPVTGSDGSGAGGISDGEIKDLAEQLLDDIESRKDIRDEVRRTQRLISGGDASDILDKAKFNQWPVIPDFSQKQASLSRSLAELLKAADPGWHRGERSGRVNARRWVQDRDYSTAFDRWDEGVHDAVDMEVVIMIDESGSMGRRIERALNAAWAIKKTLDGIGASTTVITFDTESRILFHRTEKAESQSLRYSYSGGGTNPVDGLEQAARIFSKTRKTQKILIIFTDGEWQHDFYDSKTWQYRQAVDSNGNDGDTIIANLNRSGVVTALGYIGARGPLDKRHSHNCSIASGVDVDTLVPFMSGIVKSVIKQRLRGR